MLPGGPTSSSMSEYRRSNSDTSYLSTWTGQVSPRHSPHQPHAEPHHHRGPMLSLNTRSISDVPSVPVTNRRPLVTISTRLVTRGATGHSATLKPRTVYRIRFQSVGDGPGSIASVNARSLSNASTMVNAARTSISARTSVNAPVALTGSSMCFRDFDDFESRLPKRGHGWYRGHWLSITTTAVNQPRSVNHYSKCN